MEEMKVIMQGLAQMSDGAATAFGFWCLKEVVIHLMIPGTFFVIGAFVMKAIRLVREYYWRKEGK